MPHPAQQGRSVQGDFPVSGQHHRVVAAKIITEETGRLEVAFHSEVTHVFLYRLNKFHPPGEVAWESNFWEIYDFMVRHGRGSFLVSLNNGNFRSEFSPCF